MSELESSISASLELAEHLGADTAALPPDDAVILVNSILWHRTLEVPTSVLDSIIASGQVRLISNGTLRMALSQWRAFFNDVRENHEWHRVETDEHLVSYVARHLSIRDLLIRNGEIHLSPDTFAYDFEGMQRDPVFEGRFRWRVRRQQSTLIESNILLAETQDLITLIEAEIGGPQ